MDGTLPVEMLALVVGSLGKGMRWLVGTSSFIDSLCEQSTEQSGAVRGIE